MPHRQSLSDMPKSRTPVSLLAVDRAVFELRRGRPVVIAGAHGKRALVMAAEGATDEALQQFTSTAGAPAQMVLTERRAAALGLTMDHVDDAGPAVLSTTAPLQAAWAMHLSDPTSEQADLPDFSGAYAGKFDPAAAAIGLTKIARLLPSAILADITGADDLHLWASRHDLILVDAGDVFQYERTAAKTLKAVSDARVPLEDAEDTRIIAFRPDDGGLEHLAIVIGEPEDGALVRLHSECFTGDLLGSLRCDCGDQLRGAIADINTAGSGVLLYLAQEGRGIGLVNKLRAYRLQDEGFDTLDANEQLGFDADERVFLPAAEILKALGLLNIRLLTNNPNKVNALSKFGIHIQERVAHTFPSNQHNALYLDTKAKKGGHLF